jgi:DNA-binding NtrC family response regulator
MTHTSSQVKVLIAERTLSIAELIARSLRSQGYAIAGIVNSTEKAIEFATITVPDIVLLDLPLPGELDSFTVGWKILSEIQCPVVYMTTQTKDVRQQNQLLNPYGFLLKPFTVKELKTTIDQTLEQHRQQRIQQQIPAALPETPELDEQFLGILANASAISPMPRIAFSGDRWHIYTSTTDGATYLQSLCQRYTRRYPIHFFVWNWKTGSYDIQE